MVLQKGPWVFDQLIAPTKETETPAATTIAKRAGNQ
jgi:hypothetical protein